LHRDARRLWQQEEVLLPDFAVADDSTVFLQTDGATLDKISFVNTGQLSIELAVCHRMGVRLVFVSASSI
jgi:hypothetical protein